MREKLESKEARKMHNEGRRQLCIESKTTVTIYVEYNGYAQ